SVTSSFFFSISYVSPSDLHSSPTRRSSDLPSKLLCIQLEFLVGHLPGVAGPQTFVLPLWGTIFCVCGPYTWGASATSSCARSSGDRKSTRLNSSHVKISYAVLCLNKKKNFN